MVNGNSLSFFHIYDEIHKNPLTSVTTNGTIDAGLVLFTPNKG